MQATNSLRSQGIAWFKLATLQEAKGDLASRLIARGIEDVGKKLN